MTFTFSRILPDGRVERSGSPCTAFAGFQQGDVWLFVAPHDDDAVFGAALTMLAGVACGARVLVVIAADGSNGYCCLAQRDSIVDIRRGEAACAYQSLGVAPEALRWLGFTDTKLRQAAGRFPAAAGSRSAIAGYDGLSNAYTALLRQLRPRVVFLSTSADLHPDHKAAHEELLISVFHASGPIWPELGEPAPIPSLVEFSVYGGFAAPPDIRVGAGSAEFARKLAALRSFASQPQVALLIERVARGPRAEYLRELTVGIEQPPTYEELFGEPGGGSGARQRCGGARGPSE